MMSPNSASFRTAPPKPEGRIADALQDSLAVQIFDALASRAVQPPTIAALAAFVGASASDVTQRLARLEGWNLVEATSGLGQAGDVAFRATRDALITDAEWARLSVAQRRRLTELGLDAIDERIGLSLDSGGFDADDANVSWLPNDLDREGYDEMVRLGAETIERVREIQAAVIERRANGSSDGEAIRTDLVLLHFERGVEPPPGDADALREELYEAVDEIAEEAPEADADWRAVAARGRELTQLARRLATARRGS